MGGRGRGHGDVNNIRQQQQKGGTVLEVSPKRSLDVACVLTCKAFFKRESSHCPDVRDRLHCNLER